MAAIREVFLRRLTEGPNVTVAYQRACADVFKMVEGHFPHDKANLGNALQSIGIHNAPNVMRTLDTLGGFSEHALFIIVSGGGLGNVPDPVCVADRLRDKPKPTRRDIEEAFAACTK